MKADRTGESPEARNARHVKHAAMIHWHGRRKQWREEDAIRRRVHGKPRGWSIAALVR